jgi:integrase
VKSVEENPALLPDESRLQRYLHSNHPNDPRGLVFYCMVLVATYFGPHVEDLVGTLRENVIAMADGRVSINIKRKKTAVWLKSFIPIQFCPIFISYLRLRDLVLGSPRLFLSPAGSGYKAQPIGKNLLNAFLKENFGSPASSFRNRLISKGLEAGVAPNIVMARVGHTSTTAVQSYMVNSVRCNDQLSEHLTPAPVDPVPPATLTTEDEDPVPPPARTRRHHH